jgi:hypothetical protein
MVLLERLLGGHCEQGDPQHLGGGVESRLNVHGDRRGAFI